MMMAATGIRSPTTVKNQVSPGLRSYTRPQCGQRSRWGGPRAEQQSPAAVRTAALPSSPQRRSNQVHSALADHHVAIRSDLAFIHGAEKFADRVQDRGETDASVWRFERHPEIVGPNQRAVGVGRTQL